MALTQVTGPYPIFTDLDGTPLDDGYLYIGLINQDPEQNPIQIFWDSNLTIPATQPIRTSNGYAYRNGTPALLYTAGEFSITIRNKREEFVLYSPVGYGFDPAAVSASVVKNDFTGNGVQVAFVLSASPSTILATNIFINGVYQEKDSYTLAGNTITFSIAPPLGSGIEVMTNETGVINTGNATAITYTLTETGAVQQTVQTKLEQYVSVADFGAVGDNSTNDATAIQAAVNALPASGGTLEFLSGKTYVIGTPINFTGKSDFTVTGFGATIRCGATRITSYLNLDGAANATIIGLTFDGRVAQMPLYTSGDFPAFYNVGVYSNTGVAGLKVQNCTFKNLYTVAGGIRLSSNVTFSDCTFTSPAQTQDQVLQHLNFQTSQNIRVFNCDFINAAPPTIASGVCGVFASGITGQGIKIDGCNFDYCGRDNTGTHRLGVIDFYYDVDNVVVTNCVSRNTLAQFMRLSSAYGARISNNQIYMSAVCEIDYNILSVESGAIIIGGNNVECKNINIYANHFEDPQRRTAVTVGIFSYDWGAYARNISVSDNTFFNTKRTVTVLGPFSGVTIANNLNQGVAGAATGLISSEVMPGITSTAGIEADSFYDGLLISGNTLTSVGDAAGILIEIPPTTAFAGSFIVANNQISSATAVTTGTAISIEVNGPVPANNKISVFGNTIDRFTTAFQIRDSGVVKLESNSIRATVNELIQSGNYSISRANNTFRGYALSGTATLVSGSVLVNPADCSVGDTVMLSRNSTSGTAGNLSIQSVANGAFTIISSSATDTSTVNWYVIH
jgi:hypothetical protein